MFLGSPPENDNTSFHLTEMGFYVIVEGLSENVFLDRTFVFGFLS